jgi:hypothetical protein
MHIRDAKAIALPAAPFAPAPRDPNPRAGSAARRDATRPPATRAPPPRPSTPRPDPGPRSRRLATMAFAMSTRALRAAGAAPAPRRAAAPAPRPVRAHYKITVRGPEGKESSFE